MDVRYTGLTEVARVRGATGWVREVTVDRDRFVELPVAVPAEGMTWLVLE